MYKLNKIKAPLTFNELIRNPFHKYTTKFSENYFSLKAIFLKSRKYCISFRGPKIWNNFLTKEVKELQWFSLFKKVVHSKLLEGEYEVEYFRIKLSSHDTNLALSTVKHFWSLMTRLSAFFKFLFLY